MVEPKTQGVNRPGRGRVIAYAEGLADQFVTGSTPHPSVMQEEKGEEEGT